MGKDKVPAEDVGAESREVGEGGNRLGLVIDGHLGDELQEPVVLGDDVLVRERLDLRQRRRRDDEPDRLEVAEPLEVPAEFRVVDHGASSYPVTGQRYTSPIGSIRRAFTS